MRKFIDGYYRLLNVAAGASASAILIVPVTLQIISRFTALIPRWIWTEEMARFLFIWMVMLGAMVGVRDGTHFDVDVWPELKPRANALLRIVSMLFVLVFALVFVWCGIEFVAVRLEPDLRARRAADVADLRRLAARPASPGCCSAASASRPTAHARAARAGDDARRATSARERRMTRRRRSTPGRWRAADRCSACSSR